MGIWPLVGLMLVVAAVGVMLLPSSDQTVLWRTLIFAFSASVIAIPFAVLAAVCLHRGVWLRSVLLFSLIALAVIPPYINVSCWDSAFGKLGWLTSAQGQILQPLLSGWSAGSWVHAVGLVPQFALLFFWAMMATRTFEEQAQLDLPPRIIFFHITLRRLLPMVLLCMLWALIVCSREIAVTDLYQIGTLAEQIYLGYSLGQVNALATKWSPEEIQAAGSIGFAPRAIQFLFLVTVSCAFFSVLAGFSKDSSSTIKDLETRPATGASNFGVHAVGAATVLLLLVAAPVFNLIYQAGTSVSSIDGQPTQLWAFENFYRAIVKAAADFQSAFLWSALIALASSTLIILSSTFVCFWAKVNRFAWWSLILLTAFFAALSGPDIGSGLTTFFAQSKNQAMLWFYDCTIGPAVIANFVFCWPMATLVVWFAISQTTKDQFENAQLDRIGRLPRMFEFGFRQHWQLFLGIWLLIAAMCFSELSASQMVLPPGIETVPQVTLGKLHAGVNETTAALSILTIGLVVALSMTAWIILKRGIRLQRMR